MKNGVLALAVAVGLPAAAWAQEKNQGQASKSDVQVTVNAADVYRFETDLDTEGSLAVNMLKGSVDVKVMLDPRNHLFINGGIEYDLYDFSRDAELLPGVATGLFEDAFVLRGEATYLHAFDNHWSGLANGMTMTQFESGAPPSKGVAFALGLGVSYRVDADLTIGLLVRGMTRIEDSPWVYPLLYIDWRFAPQWYLTNETKAGYGFIVGRGLDEAGRIALETRAYFMSRRFRLDDDSIPSKGIVEDMRFAWDLGIRYKSDRGLSFGAYVGGDVWQMMQIEDRTGNDLNELEGGFQPYLAVYLSWAF